MSEDEAKEAPPEPHKRILSIDVLRGWNMWWLIGGADVVRALAVAVPCGLTATLAAQTHHAGNGFNHHDIIFPLFLFLAGASWPFSLAGQLRRGKGKGAITLTVLRRFAALAVLGAILFGLLSLDFAHVRFNSILGRIGFGWMFAALGSLWLSRRGFRWYAAALFFGYWAACLVLPHVFGGNDAAAWHGQTFQSIFDTWLGNRRPDKWGKEGFFQAFGCISSACLGVFAGEIVADRGLSGGRKVVQLLLWAVGCGAGAAVAFATGCPCIKGLWTPTYLLLAGAISFAELAALYWIVDVKGCLRWAFFFKVIGMNAFTIYILQWAWSFPAFGRKVFGGTAKLMPEAWGLLFLEASFVLLRWLVLYFLYRRKIFIRV